MRVLCASVLAFESIVILLAIPVAIQVSDLDAGVAWWAAVPAGLALLAAGLLRSRVGYVLGSIVQVLAIAMGVVVPAMYVLGVLFGALWVLAIVLGHRAEAIRAQRAAGP